MSNDPALYVDGVPVKISERFRPPRKVKLNASCNYQVNTEVLTEEYDFYMENETLEWLQKRKASKETKHSERKVAIANYEEKKRKKQEEEFLKMMKLKEEQEKLIQEELLKMEKLKEEKDKITEEEINKKDAERLKEAEGKENIIKESDSEVDEKNSEEEDFHDIEKSEEPVRKSSIQLDNEDYAKKMKESNSIGDFENTKSSEDYNIVKSPILNHVQNIDHSQHIYPSVLIPTQCSPISRSSDSAPNTNTNINFAEFEGDASDPFDSVALKSINDMEELAKILQTSHVEKPIYQNQYIPSRKSNDGYPDGVSFASYQNYPQSIMTHPSTYGSYQKIPLQNVPLSNDNSSQPLQQPIYQHWKNSSSVVSPPNEQQSNQFSYGNIPLSSSPATTLPMPISNIHGSTNNASTDSSAMSSVVPKRQDLEDFYSRYYLNKKVNTPSNVRSGQNTPTSNMFDSLKSSTSVPDLTAAEDSEVSNIISCPSNHGQPKPSVSNPPSRPSSIVGIEGFHKNTSCMVSPKVRLPDPFTELTSDAQALVQSMAEMGFPRPRVARAVQKLGIDHKKLLEVLLVLQTFKDNGEDEYRAERAFYFYMGEIPKVKDFLAAAKTLLDLGFDEEIVIDHLFRNQNDKDKCLEELIT